MITQFVDLTGGVLNWRLYRGDPVLFRFSIDNGAGYAAHQWRSEIRTGPGGVVVAVLDVQMVVVDGDAQVAMIGRKPDAESTGVPTRNLLEVGTYAYDMQESSDGELADGFTMLRGKIKVVRDVTL